MLQKLRRQEALPSHLFRDYLEVCGTVSRQLENAGLNVPGFGPGAEARFRSHPDPRRVLDVLKIYSEVLQAQLDAGASLRDDKKLLWRMLSRMGYTPRSDLFDMIPERDVIEIFTGDNLQIFRNMTYFDLIHITVDELATLRWSRDYKRPWAFLLSCFRIGVLFKSGLMKETCVLPMDRHEVAIHASGLWQKFSIRLNVFSPLKRGSKLEAFVVTSDPRPVPGT